MLVRSSLRTVKIYETFKKMTMLTFAPQVPKILENSLFFWVRAKCILRGVFRTLSNI